LLAEYEAKKELIRARLEDFRRVWETADDHRLFEELVFCILAAGSSALMGMRGVEALRPYLLTGSAEDLASFLKHVRFHTTRARYIVHVRQHLMASCGLNLRRLIISFPDPETRREYFAASRAIKGIGYKEASHFLRNIGFTGYGILDKHITGLLWELGRSDSPLPPTTRSRYLQAENSLKSFAHHLKISVDELDLLLWSHKTGMILK